MNKGRVIEEYRLCKCRWIQFKFAAWQLGPKCLFLCYIENKLKTYMIWCHRKGRIKKHQWMSSFRMLCNFKRLQWKTIEFIRREILSGLYQISLQSNYQPLCKSRIIECKDQFYGFCSYVKTFFFPLNTGSIVSPVGVAV